MLGKMDQPDPTYNEASGWTARIVKYVLQPAALVAVLWYWSTDPSNPLAFAFTIVPLHIVLGTLEHWMPARPGWLYGGWLKVRNIALVAVLTLTGRGHRGCLCGIPVHPTLGCPIVSRPRCVAA